MRDKISEKKPCDRNYGYTCTVQGQRNVFVTFDRNPQTGIQNIYVSL